MAKRRRWLYGIAGTVLVLGVAVTQVPPLLFADRTDYGPIVPIDTMATYQDASLLARGWEQPAARRYHEGGAVDFQKNPSFCGPASVVNVERSLGGGDDQDHVLEGSGLRTFLGMVPGGLTLDQEATLVGLRTGRKATVLRDLSLEEFRAEMVRSNDPSNRYIVNFTRKPLFGRGGGHFSPVGGYLADKDLVFVLDVNRHYQPWLVPTERLWQAANTIDRASGKKRGLVRIE